MISRSKFSLQNSRNDCFAPDRIDTLDYEQLVLNFYEKQKVIKQLQKQLDEVDQQVAACVAVLKCSNAAQLSNTLSQHEGVPAPPTAVPLETCQALERCLQAEQQVSLHKFLGTEIMQVTGGKLLCKIHTQDVRPGSLPLQMFTISKAPNSEFYKMRPREITYHLVFDLALRNLMARSSYDDIILCFRKVQSLIFDLVHCDNIYHTLTQEKSIQNSLACSKSRQQISFTLPTSSPTSLSGLNDGLNTDARQLKNIKSLKSLISISLQFDHSAERGWGVDIHYPLDRQFESIPENVSQALATFLASLVEQDVVTCVRTLLRGVSRQSSFMDSSDSPESSESNEFAGIFLNR